MYVVVMKAYRFSLLIINQFYVYVYMLIVIVFITTSLS